jgi:hypothetical protein
VKRSALQRYRQMIRDGADPDPFRTEMAHGMDGKVVLRSPSTVYGQDFRARHPTMTWYVAWETVRHAPDRPKYLDQDEFFAGFHGNR